VKLDVELQVWFFDISDFMQIKDLEVNFEVTFIWKKCREISNDSNDRCAL